MPNHVENDLVIQGDPEVLRAFTEFAKGPAGTALEGEPEAKEDILSAQRFVPFPPEYLVRHMVCPQCGHDAGNRTDEMSWPRCPQCDVPCQDWYNRGGYDWCIKNWGTKWGMYEIELTDEDFEGGRIGYTFQSAWSPPTPVIQAMSKRFPPLTFYLDYFEGGAGFMGSCEYENG